MSSESQAIKILLRRLIRAEAVAFPRPGEALSAPSAQGVYIIYSPTGRVLHVGRTTRAKNGLRQRLGNHLQGRSSFVIAHFAGDGSKLRRRYSYSCLEVACSRQRALLEAYAVGSLCPAHIGLGEATA